MNYIESQKIFDKLSANIEAEGFRGFDPYDALNSPLVKNYFRSKNLNLILTSFFRISPLNFRSFVGIQKKLNPKSLGLILSSYCNLARIGYKIDPKKINLLFKYLVLSTNTNFSGFCWGYPFPWQNKTRYLPRNYPTVVSTVFVGNGLLDYYELTGDKRALEISHNVCNFITKDLKINHFKEGICFSYAPGEDNIVLNASALASAFLARVCNYTNDNSLSDFSTKAMEYIISKQNKSGRWDYSIDKQTGKPRLQTDWHQGFIIDSILVYMENMPNFDTHLLQSLEAGSKYYSNMFEKDGSSHWRYQTWRYPINVHNQAQGIITFSKLRKSYPEFGGLASKILNYTIKNLYSNKGYFYYQKGLFTENRIDYMRWSQSWMLLALATYIYSKKEMI